MNRKLFTLLCCAGFMLVPHLQAQTYDRLPGYVQAEKFTKDKLSKMLFSTTVDPHWFQQGNCFWYEYKTSQGNVWYVVDPAARTKKTLFDQDKIAAQLTEIVKDPFTAQQLPIQKLEAQPDGRTFTFHITSTKDAPKDTTDKKKNKKQVFYFSYDYPTQKLTWLEDKKEDTKYP